MWLVDNGFVCCFCVGLLGFDLVLWCMLCFWCQFVYDVVCLCVVGCNLGELCWFEYVVDVDDWCWCYCGLLGEVV